ncbi:hypothetical protein B0H13DRAFT_2339873 [Mycena leptocephala]|nr:hypothetical protein B0H13DRAFT_2339873 [Mycena leptocephala]
MSSSWDCSYMFLMLISRRCGATNDLIPGLPNSITPSRRHLRGRHLVSQPAAALTPATTAVQSRIENITGRGVKKCITSFTQTVWLPIENSNSIQIDAVM